tara:strand:+ start:677 stop:3088 length:2412 start_codon:yes stop_codon:yes gene_type:complete
MTLECEFFVKIEFDTTSQLFVDSPNILTLSTGQSWNSFGFAAGQSILFQWNHVDTSQSQPIKYYNAIGSLSSPSLFIDRIENEKMFVVDANGNPLNFNLWSNIFPAQFGNYAVADASIVADARPQGIRFTYGHIENSAAQNQNLSSFIDGSLTEFIAEDAHLMTVGQSKTFNFIGQQSGMSVAFCNLKYISQQAERYIYEIEISYMVSSFFDDITTFQNSVSPPETFAANSLTDNFSVVGFPVYNNPNIKIQTDLQDTAKLGNTGWFNENFNGNTNDFTLSSITYQNSAGTTLSNLDYANPVTVSAVIDGVTNLTGQTAVSYGFAWMPTEDADFKNNDFGFYKNCKMNTGGNADSFSDVFNVQLSASPDATIRTGYGIDSAVMNVQNVLFQKTGASQITFSADFIPSAALTTFFDARDITDRNYILWMSVADQNETTNKSNRVSLLLDFNQLDTFVEPIGAFEGMTIEFLDHTQNETSVSVPCGNDIRIEDDLLARVFFQIDTATAANIPVPTGLSYGIIAERQSDGFQYSLDNYSIDLTQYPNPTQFNFDASQNFKLIAGQNKNFIKLEHWSALDGSTKKGVRGLYGFKVRWEDWIKRLNIPNTVENDVFDNSEKQNGLNNNWYNWLTTTGYNLYFVVYTDALLNGKVVRYANKKQLVFVDYDANADISTESRYYRQLDNTLLSGGVDPVTGTNLGVILNNELVRLEIDYTRTSGTWTSLSNIYGLNCIEVDEGAGQREFRQLSSFVLPEADNPLIPLPSNTLLDIQIISPTVLRCTCLIDTNKLTEAQRYKVTGRQGCKTT